MPMKERKVFSRIGGCISQRRNYQDAYNLHLFLDLYKAVGESGGPHLALARLGFAVLSPSAMNEACPDDEGKDLDHRDLLPTDLLGLEALKVRGEGAGGELVCDVLL